MSYHLRRWPDLKVVDRPGMNWDDLQRGTPSCDIHIIEPNYVFGTPFPYLTATMIAQVEDPVAMEPDCLQLARFSPIFLVHSTR